jgi:PAS domain S-box-containing protein
MNAQMDPLKQDPAMTKLQSLRQLAEARFADQAAQLPASAAERTPDATQKLLHELQVHQIELEMQNDELRRAQAAIDTAQARYFDFYDLAPVGYVTVSQTGLILQANLTMAAQMGVTRDSLIDQPIYQLIGKADHDIYYFFCNQLFETGSAQSCELRMIKAGCAPFWASMAALAVPSDDGSTALRIVLSDITERKQAEERLQLAASVFSRAGEGIMVTDARSHITEVNDSFTSITGYARSEVMGRNPRMLSSGRQVPAFYASMWAELANTGYWCGELWNQHKDGTHYAQLASISAVRDTQGEVQRYVALFSDIPVIKMHQRWMSS